MYYCKNCLQSYTIADLSENKVNTMDRTAIFQCHKCFFIDGLLHNLYQKCEICFDNNTSLYFDACCHCICENYKGDNHQEKCCYFCRKSSRLINIKNHKNSEFSYYFNEQDIVVKSYFKILYCQIVDVINVGIIY